MALPLQRCPSRGSNKTQLCLYRTEPPSGARRVGTPPKSQAPFFSRFFEKISTPNSLACSNKSIVKKPKDRKTVSRPKGRSSHEMAYASELRHSLTTFCPRDSLGSEEVFCKRYVQKRDRGQRLRNTIKMIKKCRRISTLKKASTATSIMVR